MSRARLSSLPSCSASPVDLADDVLRPLLFRRRRPPSRDRDQVETLNNEYQDELRSGMLSSQICYGLISSIHALPAKAPSANYEAASPSEHLHIARNARMDLIRSVTEIGSTLKPDRQVRHRGLLRSADVPSSRLKGISNSSLRRSTPQRQADDPSLLRTVSRTPESVLQEKLPNTSHPPGPFRPSPCLAAT